MLTVHHLNNSRSHRILWLLEELGVDYEIAKYERDPKTMLAPRELREIHPLGKSPIVTDAGGAVAESGAIIEYILDEYGADEHGETRLRPAPGTPEFLRYRYWMHYAEGSAMAPLLLKIVFDQLPKQGPALAKPLLRTVSRLVGDKYVDPQIRQHMAFWEEELAKSAYFAGDEFSAADIQMSFALEAAEARADADVETPRTRDLLERLRQRPAYRRAIERGGELELS
jgi:glutathione S-transferase